MSKRAKLAIAILNIVAFLFWGSYVCFEVVVKNGFAWWKPPVLVLVGFYLWASLIAFVEIFDPLFTKSDNGPRGP